MARLSLAFRCAALVLALLVVDFSVAMADGPDPNGKWPVYQRKSRYYGSYRHHDRANFAVPQANFGWYQRPYPYHLDYYRMQYGGSYAPYFGNLYGPPEVYAPSQYGYVVPTPYNGNVPVANYGVANYSGANYGQAGCVCPTCGYDVPETVEGLDGPFAEPEPEIAVPESAP